MRILLADDHPVVRRGLREIISDALPGITFGEAADAAQVRTLVHDQQWDLVVLDISMPGTSGLELMKELRDANPRTPVFIVSMHPESEYALRALRAGAAAYITKDAAPFELVGAIKRVLAGGRYASPAVAEQLSRRNGDGHSETPHQKLSDREFEVLRLLASGKTVKEVAEELALSIKTISTYRGRLLEKMRMRTNAELTYYAIRNGLVA